jgi:hypothetical protein
MSSTLLLSYRFNHLVLQMKMLLNYQRWQLLQKEEWFVLNKKIHWRINILLWQFFYVSKTCPMYYLFQRQVF